MKKAILGAAVVVVFGTYALFKQGFLQSTPEPTLPTPTPIVMQEPTPSPSGPTPVPTPSPTPQPPQKYKDGSYTGNPITFFYGVMQVKAVISGGKLTDVQFLKYPNDRSTSIEINTQAMPILKSEAIKSQGEQVDIVSGATDSAIAFGESLSSALALAK